MTVYFSKRYTTAVNILDGITSIEQFITENDQYANAPFDEITIINSDSVTLHVNIDGNTDNRITILANSQERGSGLKYRNFTITADGGTHTAGAVHILVENTKTPRRE